MKLYQHRTLDLELQNEVTFLEEKLSLPNNVTKKSYFRNQIFSTKKILIDKFFLTQAMSTAMDYFVQIVYSS